VTGCRRSPLHGDRAPQRDPLPVPGRRPQHGRYRCPEPARQRGASNRSHNRSLPRRDAQSRSVTLRWVAPASNGGAPITDYVIQRFADRTTWRTVRDGVSTARRLTVSGSATGPATGSGSPPATAPAPPPGASSSARFLTAGQRRRKTARDPRQRASELGFLGSPYGIRTRAATLRGWCPGPLDERAKLRHATSAPWRCHGCQLGSKDSNPE
jgi:hypothetical protein